MIWGLISSAISIGNAGSWISAAASVISTVVSGIGRAISDGVKTVVSTVGTIIEKLPEYAPKVANFVSTLLQAINITRPNETAQEFGERVLQAQERGYRLDSAEKFDEYMEKLRSFELDPEKAKSRPEGQQLAAAMSVGAVGLGRRFDLAPETVALIYLLPLANDRFFTPERVQAMLAARGMIRDISDYLEGRLSPDESVNLSRRVLELEHRINPAAELAALRADLQESRRAYEGLREKIESNDGQGGSA